MGLYNPTIKGNAFKAVIALQDMSQPGSYKINPTIDAGDAKISIDQGAFANLTNIPIVSPAGTISVLLNLTAAEMNGNVIFITLVSQAVPKQWADFALCILTV